jgi:UDP:flavonoid glycosyltransferase YjiC (YdhE family)
MHFGCPMIVLPLAWDQHDNAQRVTEQGFGVRLDAWGHDPGRLVFALRRLLADDALRLRMRTAASRLQRDPGRVRAADAVELVAAHALTPAL